MARFIVNKGGATHSVSDAAYAVLIENKDFRDASGAEIEAYYTDQGLTPEGEALPAGGDESKGEPEPEPEAKPEAKPKGKASK